MADCTVCGERNSEGVAYCGSCGTAVGDGPFSLQSTICSGRYRIDSVLGQGGMGSVYAATDMQLHRHVAIKVLSPELSQKPNVRRRMEQEARALARIEDPNVVQIRNVFEENGLLVLELELVTGGDLASRIKQGPIAPTEALRLIQQILSGLQALHDADLVHRDMKPGNVLLTNKGVAKITDLGVARDAQALEKTSLGAVLGTPAYMSPEQVQGLVVDRRSDLYAAAIVFYEMLTGHLPFAGDSEWELKTAHVQHLPNLEVLRGVVAEPVIAVIAKALAKAPAERWASARAMGAALTASARRAEQLAEVQPAPRPHAGKPVDAPAWDEALRAEADEMPAVVGKSPKPASQPVKRASNAAESALRQRAVAREPGHQIGADHHEETPLPALRQARSRKMLAFGAGFTVVLLIGVIGVFAVSKKQPPPMVAAAEIAKPVAVAAAAPIEKPASAPASSAVAAPIAKPAEAAAPAAPVAAEGAVPAAAASAASAVKHHEKHHETAAEAQEEHALVDAAKAQIATVGGVVEAFEAGRGGFPESLHALTEGRNAKLKEANLTDPWKQNLIYNAQSDGFSLCSKGPDKKHGGKDDICYGTAPTAKHSGSHEMLARSEFQTSNLERAKAMIDKMARDVETMIARVEAAGTDQAKIKEITEKFKKSSEGMKSEGEALTKRLTADEKKQMEEYGKKKMAPIMGKFMGVMMKAQMQGQSPGSDRDDKK